MIPRRSKQHGGVIVPMVTPLLTGGRVDGSAARAITERLVEGGCHPLVMGTNGEGASLAADDGAELLESVIAQTRRRARVYAGVSTNSLRTAVATGRRLLELGADAVVAHPPSYFPIRGHEMLRYFELLADGLGGPLLLYNIPSTTHLAIPLEVVEHLSHHPNIVGLKDSDPDLQRLEESVERWRGRADFAHLVGSAAGTLHGLRLGSDGIVPSAGNLVPRLYRRLYDDATRGDSEIAARLQQAAEDLSALYLRDRALPESLAALKVMMAAWGLCEAHMLPPLLRLPGSEEAAIRVRLREFDRAALEGGRIPHDGEPAE
jgi:dihydrodipicolinate synthase/N-acetylneuraminate lyase